MFMEVRPNGGHEEVIINLNQVVRADYERVSQTQANVTLTFVNDDRITLEEQEGRKVLDALRGRL